MSQVHLHEYSGDNRQSDWRMRRGPAENVKRYFASKKEQGFLLLEFTGLEGEGFGNVRGIEVARIIQSASPKYLEAIKELAASPELRLHVCSPSIDPERDLGIRPIREYLESRGIILPFPSAPAFRMLSTPEGMKRATHLYVLDPLEGYDAIGFNPVDVRYA